MRHRKLRRSFQHQERDGRDPRSAIRLVSRHGDPATTELKNLRLFRVRRRPAAGLTNKAKRGEFHMTQAVNAGARLDRLPISSFHYRIFWLVGAGMFFDGYDLYVADRKSTRLNSSHLG